MYCIQFDSDGDGQISLTELREAMKKLMGEQVTNREINEILKDVDLNGDGQVDFEGKTEDWEDLFGGFIVNFLPPHSLVFAFSEFVRMMSRWSDDRQPALWMRENSTAVNFIFYLFKLYFSIYL